MYITAQICTDLVKNENFIFLHFAGKVLISFQWSMKQGEFSGLSLIPMAQTVGGKSRRSRGIPLKKQRQPLKGNEKLPEFRLVDVANSLSLPL